MRTEAAESVINRIGNFLLPKQLHHFDLRDLRKHAYIVPLAFTDGVTLGVGVFGASSILTGNFESVAHSANIILAMRVLNWSARKVQY